MGFFIRKSFRAGPVRFNLSKRGLGASIGVKGARIGISSSGRAYAAGGRGGLYFRSNLGGRARSRGRPASSAAAEAIAIEADTGATFAAPSRPRASTRPAGLLGPKPNHHLAMTILGVPAAAALVLIVVFGAADTAGQTTLSAAAAPIIALAAIACAALVIRQVMRAAHGARFAKDLPAGICGPKPAEDVPRLREQSKATAADISYHARGSYMGYLRETVADRRVEDSELSHLALLEREFKLPKDFIRAARISAFRGVYLQAVADHALDIEEEQALRHIRERLAIPDADLAEEIEAVSRLSEIRGIREGRLPVIETRTKLQRGEICHFEGEGRLVKLKTLRRFQQDGQKHRIEGLTIEKEGTLLVTSKRLLLVHEGTTSIPLDRILDVEVDLDRNLISVVKDGAQKPVLFTTRDVQRAGAALAAAAQL